MAGSWRGRGGGLAGRSCFAGKGSAAASVGGLGAGGAAFGRRSPRRRTSSPQPPGLRRAAQCTSWRSGGDESQLSVDELEDRSL